MREIFWNTLVLSAVGSVAYGLLKLLSVLGGDRLSQGWRYRALLAAGTLFVLPLHRLWRLTPRRALVTQAVGAASGMGRAALTHLAVAVRNGRMVKVAAGIWLAVALGLAVWNLVRLLRCRRALLAGCGPAEDRQKAIADAEARRLGLRREVRLLVSPLVRSPVMVGFFRPAVILTTREMSDEGLRLILAHELTHFQRLDLWKKLFFMALRCVHWFNPAVYFLGRDFAYRMETACDERVVSRFSPFERKSYGYLLIDCAPNARNEAAVAFVAFASNRKRLERRISTMLHSNKKTRKVLGIVLALVLMAGCMAITAFAAENSTWGKGFLVTLGDANETVLVQTSEGTVEAEAGTYSYTGTVDGASGELNGVWYDVVEGDCDVDLGQVVLEIGSDDLTPVAEGQDIQIQYVTPDGSYTGTVSYFNVGSTFAELAE